jgi:hypothetical protein
MLERLKYKFLFWKNRRDFAQVEQFVLFSGYPRSGHSLVGALMDAHPQMIISHELDAMEMVIQGYDYKQIYAMILRNSRCYAQRGRSWSGYSYTVHGQWQGKFNKLLVIGDKRGGRTSLLLGERFSLIDLFKEAIPVPVKVIHVVRNPFDNIITRVQQGNDVRREITDEGVREQIKRHFEQADTNYRLMMEGGCQMLTLRHEALIQNPRETLIGLCNFLGLDAPDGWLHACAGMLFEKPKKTRHEYDYPKETIDEIHKHIDRFPFLKGYTYVD